MLASASSLRGSKTNSPPVEGWPKAGVGQLETGNPKATLWFEEGKALNYRKISTFVDYSVDTVDNLGKNLFKSLKNTVKSIQNRRYNGWKNT
ncbi:MAG: hypothetical protein M1269_11515 [Chloroflexi bacterium]|nr:hypothetical protein [Chloroflexota bacterium]